MQGMQFLPAGFRAHPFEVLRQSQGDGKGYYFGNFVAVQFFDPFLDGFEL